MVAGRLQFQKMPEKTGERPAYVVFDNNGQQLAYAYFEDDPERRSVDQVAQQG